jgi:Ala-tRNA(Pro) deacylase
MEVYHKTVAIIQDLLHTHDVWFETFEHEAVRTSEEAAATRTGYTITQGAKALIVRVKYKGGIPKGFVQIVLPGDTRFDVKKAREVLHASDIRFASEEEVADITDGVLPGGVPPFGNVFGLEVYCDASLLENEKIVFNAGDRRFSIGMKSLDYRDIVQPHVVEVV